MTSNRNFVKFNASSFRPDPKPERKEKAKKPYRFKKKPTGEKEVFEMIWKERPHKSQITGDPIHEARPINFLHVLPKAQNKYPKFKLLKQNIILGTEEDHYAWDHARESIKDSPKWKWVFELETQLKEKYKTA
jgi:hypothetical protein